MSNINATNRPRDWIIICYGFKSFTLAKEFLNKSVDVIIDRQLGSFHPKWNFKYPINYGYIKNVLALDGEELDAYVLNINQPLENFTGKVVAIIHRLNDDDDKLIVISEGDSITDEEIEKQVEFQENFFKHQIYRL